MLTLNKWDLGIEGWNAGTAGVECWVWGTECWIVGVGYWDKSFGMLGFRGKNVRLKGEILVWTRPNVRMERVNVGLEKGSTESKGWYFWTREAECWEEGMECWTQIVECWDWDWMSKLAWECWNVQSMVFLSSVGMLSCRGCPILWMIPCYLYEPPPSRYNFLKIQLMFFSLILLSVWILLFSPGLALCMCCWFFWGLSYPFCHTQ